MPSAQISTASQNCGAYQKYRHYFPVTKVRYLWNKYKNYEKMNIIALEYIRLYIIKIVIDCCLEKENY